MTRVVVLPHEELCPEGKVIDVPAGTNLCKGLLDNGIDIDHACEMSCGCTTCHVIVAEGIESLPFPSEREDDLLDKAWGVEPDSRLSCQVIVQDTPLVIEIPKYTVNIVKENKA